MIRKIGLTSLAVLIFGCGSTSTSYINKSQANTNTPIIKKQTPPIANKFSLTINTAPNNARVRILNISPKYQDGIKLLKGKYHIEVSLSGFKSYKEWVYLQSDKTFNVKLKRIPTKIKQTKDYFHYVDNVIWGNTGLESELFNVVLDQKNKKVWAVPKVNIESFFSAMYGVKGERAQNKVRKSHFTTMDLNEDIYVDDTFYKNVNNFYLAGSSSWRLPTKNEIKKNYPYANETFEIFNLIKTKYRYFYLQNKSFYYQADDGVSRFQPISGNNYYFVLNKDNDRYNNYKKTKLAFSLVRDFTDKDNELLHGSFSEKIARLTTSLTIDKLKLSKDEIPLPVKKKPIIPIKIEKNEFEKTSNYLARVSKENERVEKINHGYEKQYQLELSIYESRIEDININHQAKLDFNQSESTIKNTANTVVNQAIKMILGNPKFKDLKYNADSEKLHATLYSTISDYSKDIEIPVPLAEAKQLKADLMNSKLIPSVYFNIRNKRLEFDRVKVVDNKAMQEQNYNKAKSTNTIASFKHFLNIHPNSPQSSQAKSNILKLKEKQRLARIEAERREKERAKQKRRAKEQEQRAYMKRKAIGEMVCKDGRVALGLIGVTISAYVESVKNDAIQIRINSTEGQSINYNGGSLYQGKVIWDKYYEWKACN